MDKISLIIRPRNSLMLALNATEISFRRLYSADKLAFKELGVLQETKSVASYETGQAFIHRLFGYRGVILFPWSTTISENPFQPGAHGDSQHFPLPIQKRSTSITPSNNLGTISNKNSPASQEVKSSPNRTTSSNSNRSVRNGGRQCWLYQVLMDQRDIQRVSSFLRESVTFLTEKRAGRLQFIPGLDIADHNDIVPYKPVKQVQHELVAKFFDFNPVVEPSSVARSLLRNWIRHMQPALDYTAVYRQCSPVIPSSISPAEFAGLPVNLIRVTVMPFFLGSHIEKPPHVTDDRNQTKTYWWRYNIRIENLGRETVQLRERFWRVLAVNGTQEIYRGAGVIGCEPLLSLSTPIFQYSSHISLQVPGGKMWGSFGFQRESDGQMFEVQIPPFALESPDVSSFVSANPDTSLPGGSTAVSAKPKPSSVLTTDPQTPSRPAKSSSAPSTTTAASSQPSATPKAEKASASKSGSGVTRSKKASDPELSPTTDNKSEQPATNVPSSEPILKNEAAAPADQAKAQPSDSPNPLAPAKEKPSETQAEAVSGLELGRWPPALKHHYSDTNGDADWCSEPALEPADDLSEYTSNGEGAAATDENGKKKPVKRSPATNSPKQTTKASQVSDATDDKRRQPRAKSTRSDRDANASSSNSGSQLEVEEHSDTNANGGPKTSP